MIAVAPILISTRMPVLPTGQIPNDSRVVHRDIREFTARVLATWACGQNTVRREKGRITVGVKFPPGQSLAWLEATRAAEDHGKVSSTHTNFDIPVIPPYFDRVAVQCRKLHTYLGTLFRASETHTICENRA